MYRLLLALIYLAFISLGLPDSLLGAGWPAMHVDMKVSVASMGVVSMVISGCTILSSLFSEKLTRRCGTRIVTAVSVLLTAVALYGFSLSSAFWMLILWAVPYGLGAGAIDAALNNYVAIHYSSRHMSWLHCFWGIGAIASPFVMSYALGTSVWNDGYRIVGGIQLVIAAVLFITLPVWRIHQREEGAEEGKEKSRGLFGALKMKGVPTQLLGFLCYCAAESTAMGWAGTYFAQAKGVDVETAARFASLFFIGITASRFVSGFVTNKFGDRKMILIGTGILTCGLLCLLIPSRNITFAVVAFVAIGFGCGPIYPSIIHATPDNFGAENSQAIIGLQMAGAYVGSMFMPPLFGLLGSLAGYDIMPVFLLVFFALMLILLEMTFRITAKYPSSTRSQ